MSGLVSLNTAKSVSIAQSRKTMNDAMPITYSYYKAYSYVKRPFDKKTANYNKYFNKRVNTTKSTRVNTARPNAEVNTIEASASWVWKPKHEELDHVSKSNSTLKTLTRYDYVDALGRFKKFKNHSSDNEESLGEDASKQGRIDNVDAEVNFIDETSNDARNKNNKSSNNKRWKMIKKQL
ncbi:hypothetical protein Tco_0450755 [Tanacetum coccineum]